MYFNKCLLYLKAVCIELAKICTKLLSIEINLTFAYYWSQHRFDTEMS